VNVFACLVHEEPACVRDLVANLRHLDPESGLLLYNGGRDAMLLDGVDRADRHTVVHPQPRTMVWGDLLDFALDCMQCAAKEFDYETITMVDSDQLLITKGWSAAVAAATRDRPELGLLGNATTSTASTNEIDPTRTAEAERELWQPILETLPARPAVFPQWTFWPSTVVTRAAGDTLLALFDRDDVKRARRLTRVLATEEILIPTLVCAAGFQSAASPESFAYVKFRHTYTEQDLHDAMATPGSYWMHPVPRRYDHPLRRAVRGAHHGYVQGSIGV
jgi:hypothetical protein